MNDAKINAIKKGIQTAFKFTEEELNKFWKSKHPFLGDRSPEELSKSSHEMDFKKLKLMITISIPKDRKDRADQKKKSS